MAFSDDRPIKVEILDMWKFKQEGTERWYQAEVPGCVHTDLMKNNLIPDPFFGTNEQSLQWIGEKNWIYETIFDVPSEAMKKETIELVLEGLDTYAEVTLNDLLILNSDNMFRTWRVSCKNILHPKKNRIIIRFKSIFEENLTKYKSAQFELQACPNNDQADVKIAMYSRKAQFHYGWDWGPRLITCGIWRPVYLEAWSNFKINNIQIEQKNVSANGVDIFSIVEISSNRKQQVTASILIDSLNLLAETLELQTGINKFNLTGHIVNPKLWWTNGLGEQYLYVYKVVIKDEIMNRDEYSTQLGVRSVEVVRENDSFGTSMYIRLNGIPVFMKGANYIPQDNFQNRVTPERYEYIIRSAAEAHMNMLRVWGGGIYENDLFYDLCDRYGILVWQDMMFACAMYPGDDKFLENVKQEVIDNVIRIRNHACLAMYCGNNENEVAWYQWGWKEKYDEPTQQIFEQNVKKLFYVMIPSVIRETDSTRYYHPTSPIAGFGNIPNSAGDIHYWGVWHGNEPFETYTSNIARFMSEYGFQSYPELSTVMKYANLEDRQLHSDVMNSHQRCLADERRDKEYGNRLIQNYIERWYHVPKNFELYLYVSQVLQAEGVRAAMEAHRRAMPYCMGSLYWQINDCWPVASWSSIDYYGRWKALHYTARNSFAQILISPDISEDKIKIYVVSDQQKDTEATLDITAITFNGKKIFNNSVSIKVKANSSECATTLEKQQIVGEEDQSRLILITVLKNGEKILAQNISYFKSPKELQLEKPKYSVNITKSETGYNVELTANTLAKNVYLTCGDVKEFVSDNYFDLLPDMKKIIMISTDLGKKEFERRLKIVSLVDSYE